MHTIWADKLQIMSTTGKYSESLPCGGTLSVTRHDWRIDYYFPGKDRRYKGTSYSITGAKTAQFIEAAEQAWAEYESTKAVVPKGGTFSKDLPPSITIYIGPSISCIFLVAFHVRIDTKKRLIQVLDGYRYAMARAPKLQALLAEQR